MPLLCTPIAQYVPLSQVSVVDQFHLLMQPTFGEWFLTVRHNDIHDKWLPTQGLCLSRKERKIKDAFAENHLRHRMWLGVVSLDKMSQRR